MLLGKRKDKTAFIPEAPQARVTSVIGPGINWNGDLRGSGGVRIEGTLNGEVNIRGLVIIGETGKVTCRELIAETAIIAGYLKGDIISEKLEIRSTGRVWGNVVTTSFSSEDGAFLRGQMRMEEKIELPIPENSLEEGDLNSSQPDEQEENEIVSPGEGDSPTAM